MLINKLMYGARLLTEQKEKKNPYTKIESLKKPLVSIMPFARSDWKTHMSLGIQTMCKVLTTINSWIKMK